MAQLQTVESNENFTGKSSSSKFIKKVGVKYCVCGKECSSTDAICECGREEFIFGGHPTSNEIIGGYIELAKNGRLKDFYYKNINRESIVKMNDKRIIQQLLINKHRIVIPKEFIDKIYNANT